MAQAKDLIEKLLTASRVGFKSVWVGRSGSLLLTFYSVEAARKAAALIADFAEGLKIADGYDDSDMLPNGQRDYRKVYRVAGRMAA